jgi:photosystem II stability/assembly factor-like uncharacterized protein
MPVRCFQAPRLAAVVASFAIWGLTAVSGIAVVAVPAFGGGLVPPPPSEWCWNEGCQGEEHKNEHYYKSSFFSSSDTGYVADDRIVLRTRNGGRSWTPLLRSSIPNGRVYAFFVDDSTLFIYFDLGAGGLIRSTDGGATFQRMSHTVHSLDRENEVESLHSGFFFLDADRGWACSKDLFLRTTNGGKTWETQRLRAVRVEERLAPPSKLVMFNAEKGIAIGDHYIVRTENGGHSWHAVPHGANVTRVDCVSDGFCVAIDSRACSTAYVTADYGETWVPTETGLDCDERVKPDGSHVSSCVGRDRAEDVQVFAPDVAMIVGARSTECDSAGPRAQPERAFLSRWDGRRWECELHPELQHFYSIRYVTRDNLWATADVGGILRSSDGGHTWKLVSDYYLGGPWFRRIRSWLPIPTLFPRPIRP